MKKPDTWFIGDTHFGHENIIKFDSTKDFRPFESIYQHDHVLVENWNSVVQDDDKVYLVGDVAFRSQYQYLGMLKGKITIVLGNHDYANKIDAMLQHPHVKVCGSAEFGGGIITHIPVHPCQLERWKFNIHGHMHTMSIKDARYACVSAEQINLTPIKWEVLRKQITPS